MSLMNESVNSNSINIGVIRISQIQLVNDVLLTTKVPYGMFMAIAITLSMHQGIQERTVFKVNVRAL